MPRPCQNLYKKFIKSEGDVPEDFFAAMGDDRDYAVDLIPKFIMADGLLAKILVHTRVVHYLDFKRVDGSYVYKSGGVVDKVPATEGEALSTSLVGFFQKRRLRNFLQFIAKYKQSDPSTHDGFNCATSTTRELMSKFSLDDNTVDFVVHAMALQSSDECLNGPALPVVEAIQLYASSLARFGGSPFIYPAYGLGGLPESFSRLCAVNGGTFMLHQDVDEILYDSEGKFAGIRCGDAAASATTVIGDPSYFPADKVKREGRVIRTILLLNHGLECLKGVQSGQIILPQKQIGRHNDVYVTVLGPAHHVVAEGRCATMVSTVLEGSGDGKDQVAAGVALCGAQTCRFDNITDIVTPVDDGTATRTFITSSYDASSHFQGVAQDALRMYECITGKPLVLTNPDE